MPDYRDEIPKVIHLRGPEHDEVVVTQLFDTCDGDPAWQIDGVLTLQQLHRLTFLLGQEICLSVGAQEAAAWALGDDLEICDPPAEDEDNG